MTSGAVHLRQQLGDRADVAERADRRRRAERNGVRTAAFTVKAIDHLLDARRALLTRRDVFHLRAEQLHQQCVAGGARGRFAVHHEDALQPEPCRDRRGHPGMIRLHAARRHQRIRAVGGRVRGDHFELADLVAAARRT